MYIDVNGKTGLRGLVGSSGKTYGNFKLFSAEEKAAAAADGVVEYTPPAPIIDEAKVAEKKEKQRVSNIKNEARQQIFSRAVGTTEYNDAVLKELNMLMKAVTILNSAVDLTVLPQEQQDAAQALIDSALEIEAIRQASNEAETNGDSPMKFRFDLEQTHGTAPKDEYPLVWNEDHQQYVPDVPVE